ncbi:MAG: PepSY domain-containing protein [Paracoccaceae bacterium]
MARLFFSLALVVGMAFPALAEESVDATTQDKLTKLLTDQGYEIRRIDAEDGLIEVYALKGGHKLEIYFDKDLKQVEVREMDD